MPVSKGEIYFHLLSHIKTLATFVSLPDSSFNLFQRAIYYVWQDIQKFIHSEFLSVSSGICVILVEKKDKKHSVMLINIW